MSPQSKCLSHSGIEARLEAAEKNIVQIAKDIDSITGEFRAEMKESHSKIIRIMLILAAFTGGASGLDLLF